MRKKNYRNEIVFDFDDDHVKSKLNYDLDMYNRMGKAFDYIHATLTKLGHCVNGKKRIPKINPKKLQEDKNYKWIAVTFNNVKMVIRVYNTHLTVFTCLEETRSYEKGKTWTDKYYGAFMYNTLYDKIKAEDVIPGVRYSKKRDDEDYLHDYYMDELFENPFLVFNTHLPKLIEMIKDRNIRSLWNSYSFERPHFVKVKTAFEGSESINSVDEYIFCAQELSFKHTQLFAENDMLEEIKKFKVGDHFEGKHVKGIIKKVCTEVEDDYYHNVGLKIGDKWEDVYALTNWNVDAVFKTKEQHDQEKERKEKRIKLIEGAMEKLTKDEQTAIKFAFLL